MFDAISCYRVKPRCEMAHWTSASLACDLAALPAIARTDLSGNRSVPSWCSGAASQICLWFRSCARDAARELATGHALGHPAWGNRNLWAMIRHDGHWVSQSTVLWLLLDDGLILSAEYQKQRRKLGLRTSWELYSAPKRRSQSKSAQDPVTGGYLPVVLKE